MKPTEQETRETFRDYAINERPIYEGITGPAQTLAANLRGAISVYLAEVAEVLEWELIGQYNTRTGSTPAGK